MAKIMKIDVTTEEELREIENPNGRHDCKYVLVQVRKWELESIDNAFGDNYRIFTLKCGCGKVLSIKSKEAEIING